MPTLSIYLTDAELGALDAIARRDERSRSWVLRRALAIYAVNDAPPPTVRNAILSRPGVRAVGVEGDDHRMAISVEGGGFDDVARAIFDSVPMGVETVGPEAADFGGHVVRFSWVP